MSKGAFHSNPRSAARTARTATFFLPSAYSPRADHDAGGLGNEWQVRNSKINPPFPIVLPGRSNSFVFPSRFHLVSPRLFHFKRLFRLCSRLTCRSPVPPPSLQTPALLHVFCPFTSSRTLFLFSISHHLFYFKKFSMAARAVLGRRSTGTHLLHPTRQVRSSSSVPRIRSNSNVRACDQSPSPSQVRGEVQFLKRNFCSPLLDVGFGNLD